MEVSFASSSFSVGVFLLRDSGFCEPESVFGRSFLSAPVCFRLEFSLASSLFSVVVFGRVIWVCACLSPFSVGVFSARESVFGRTFFFASSPFLRGVFSCVILACACLSLFSVGVFCLRQSVFGRSFLLRQVRFRL